MRENITRKVERYLAGKKQRALWIKIMSCLACVVVFCTVYALILPGVALENVVCGIEEHVHDETCYVSKGKLNCGKEESEGHVHTDDCFTVGPGELICGIEESEGHIHADACYDEEGMLICPLEESDAHEHSDVCYEQRQVQICTLEETEAHKHTEECLGEPELCCVLPEHVHTSECYAQSELTMEEQALVEEVIALIDALPTREEIEETLAAFEDAGDEDGYDACLAETVIQAKAAYEAYSALTEAQKEKVTNAAKLMALEPLWSVQQLPEQGSSNTDPVRLFEYAANNKGEVNITVSDKNGILDPDSVTGEYNVTAGETYKVRVAYDGNELEIGRYYVTFASNIDLTQSGTLLCKDNQGAEINAGSWYFEKKEDGTVWLIFDITGDLSHHSGIILTADVTCQFDYTDEPMVFDGNITVRVEHNEDSSDTKVDKSVEGRVSNGKIQWKSEIYGNSGSQIIGSTITDTIITPNTHYFSAEDMEAGIIIEAVKYKTESSFAPENREASHSWTVKKGDAGLTWDETSWTYTMPETIKCETCGETITLGNDDWLYSMQYTSTVKESLPDGYNYYENKIVCDGDEATDSTYTGGTHLDAEVEKDGKYTQVPDDGKDPKEDNLYANDTIDWTITAKIPSARANEKFDYFWYIVDTLQVKEGDKTTDPTNTLSNITVTAEIDGQTSQIHEYGTQEAANAEICWRRHEQNGADLQIDFYTKCKCTEANCPTWDNNKCNDTKNQGFCRCWSYNKDVRIKVTYSTPVSTTENGNLADRYGGRGARLVNSVVLWNKEKDSSGKFQKVWRDKDQDAVPIPGVFTKQLTGKPEENGLIARYTITVNEAMADFGKLNSLDIQDTMSPTLSFIASSLEIQYEDVNGRKGSLPKDQYDVSGVSITQDGNKKFTITLHKEALGPRKYTLTYGARVSGDTGGLTYKNDASVYLFGKNQEVTGTIQDVPQAAITARTYAATLLKYDEANPRISLNDAVFELHAVTESGADGPCMYEYTTGVYKASNGLEYDGIAQVETLPAKDVVLHSHTLYFVKEKEAPEGYQLDTTKHYFWFCNDENQDNVCDYASVYAGEPYNAVCIRSGTDADTVDLKISNKAIPSGHELPNTGGSGTIPYTIGGLLTIGAGSLLLYKDKKCRRKNPKSS